MLESFGGDFIMINASRIIISGNLIFDNCRIYNKVEQENMGLPDVFENDQLYFEDSLGYCNLTPDYSITVVEFHDSRIPYKAMSNGLAVKLMRICISSDITHSPAWIIPPQNYEKLGVPMIFDELAQFTFFTTDKILYITSDVNVPLIQYRKSKS